MQGCDKCDSGNVKTEIMFRVAGQEGKSPERIEVSKCEGCGNQWSKTMDS